MLIRVGSSSKSLWCLPIGLFDNNGFVARYGRLPRRSSCPIGELKLAIRLKGIGRRWGREIIRFLESDGQIEDDV